jgi:thiazole/oxazole-forming peptide maturase SagD family component
MNDMPENADRTPLYVLPGVARRDGGISIIADNKRHTIPPESAPLAWAILERCDGHSTIEDVVRAVGSDHPELDAQTLRQAIADLYRLGVLVDSTRAVQSFHPLTMWPQRFAPGRTQAELEAQLAGPRLPVHEGDECSLPWVADSHLMKLLVRRSSCRSFSTQGLTREDLSFVLAAGYDMAHRTTPSAGGLYPLKLYVLLTQDQADLSEGYYEYDPEAARLVRFARIDHEFLRYASNSDPVVFGAPVIVVIAADFERHAYKYGNTGYLFTVLEAGMALQNMLTAATERELASVAYGGLAHRALGAELGMPDGRVAPLVAAGFGHAAPAEPSSTIDDVLVRISTALVEPHGPVKRLRSTPVGNMGDHDGQFYAASVRIDSTDDADALGRATTMQGAALKAIVEAAEAHQMCELRVDAEATVAQLQARWLDPRMVAPLTPEQLQRSPHLQLFDERQTMQWVRGTELGTDEPVYVPVELAFCSVHEATLGRKPVAEATSSGVAAHTDRRAAIRGAVLELVERHAILSNWFARIPRPIVPPEMLPYHWQRRTQYWAERAWTVDVLDLSCHGVVAVAVIAVADRGEYPAFVSGSAASLIAKRAVAASGREPLQTIEATQVRTPRDHGRFYAYPKNITHLRWLWSGPESLSAPEVTTTFERLIQSTQPVVIDLGSVRDAVHVVRAISPALIPIQFGYGNEYYAHKAIEILDPQSRIWPHYVA